MREERRLKTRFFQTTLAGPTSTTTKLCPRPKSITTRAGHRAHCSKVLDEVLLEATDRVFYNLRDSGSDDEGGDLLRFSWAVGQGERESPSLALHPRRLSSGERHFQAV